MVDRCDGNKAGCALLEAGYIEIADKFNKDCKQSEGSKINTFYHELVHSILGTMAEEDLNYNEKFVSAFSSFLCEAMTTAKYD